MGAVLSQVMVVLFLKKKKKIVIFKKKNNLIKTNSKMEKRELLLSSVKKIGQNCMKPGWFHVAIDQCHMNIVLFNYTSVKLHELFYTLSD